MYDNMSLIIIRNMRLYYKASNKSGQLGLFSFGFIKNIIIPTAQFLTSTKDREYFLFLSRDIILF